MNWLYENPWPIIGVLLLIAFVAFLSAAPRNGLIVLACVLLSIGLFFLEKYLVSPGEQIRAELDTMLVHFKERDIEAVGGQLSAKGQELKDLAQRGLDLVEISDSFHIRSTEVTFESDARAVVMVRANGTVTAIKHGNASQHIATYWKTIWVKEEGNWKLEEVSRLNVTNGEEIDTFSSAQTATAPSPAIAVVAPSLPAVRTTPFLRA